MSFRLINMLRLPMVVILGATGTGKTKLGVELAQKFDTEIISADSMQVYKALNVVTAKATHQERLAAPHHLLDLLEPNQAFTVVDFRNRALKIIDDMIEKGKIPIIVGGTNYYIESIVWNILVEKIDDSECFMWEKDENKRKWQRINQKDAKRIKTDDKVSTSEEVQENIEIISSPKEVDESKEKLITSDIVKESKEESATFYAKGSNEKICDKSKKAETYKELLDTLEQLEKNMEMSDDKDRTSNKRESSVDATCSGIQEVDRLQLENDVENESQFTNEEVHAKLKAVDPVMAGRLHPNNRRKVLRAIEVWLKTGRRHSELLSEQKLTEGKLRRPGSILIFWLKCEQKVHDERLDKRVDEMIENGLVQELLDFHARYNQLQPGSGLPPDYTKGLFQTLGFKEFHEYLMLPEDERNTDKGKELFCTSVNNMKLATRRFARRQNKMVQTRFLDHPTREIPPIYELNTTEISKWNDNVLSKAIRIIERFVSDAPCEHEPLKRSSAAEEKKNLDGNSPNYCEICQRIIIGDLTYKIHMNSFKHKKMLRRLNKTKTSES